MVRVIDEINEMSNRHTLGLLNEAITDTVDHGYTGAIVILTNTDGINDDGECTVCITNTGLDGGEVIATLRGALTMFINEAMGLGYKDEGEEDGGQD